MYLSQMKKLRNGSKKQQNKEMKMHKLTWEICIELAKVSLNQMKKLSNGMGSVFLSQMKRLSNGGENQQNKEEQMRNIFWDLCMQMGKACLAQMKKL
uniref:Uncharacterized protein n=1 Tax=Plectus sambesii TaxID=2011161 RepID=A0A914WI93_9BILA